MPNLDVLDFSRVPRDLPHRNAELETIQQALSPIADGSQGRPVRIHGPSGAGKTSVATEAARKARREWGTPFVVVDSMRTRTRASTLHEIASGLGCPRPLDGTPPKVFHDYLRDEVEHAVVVVDEAGRLEDLDLLQELVENESVTPIVICHKEDELLARAGDRVASRLRRGPTINCRPYSVAELVDILDSRIRAGSLSHLVDEELLRTVANASSGNARDAIAILARVIEHAHREGVDAASDLVAEVEPEARKDVVRRNLSKLDTPHRTIYRIIYEAGEIRAGELADRVDEELGISDAERTRYLQALQGSYEVIKSDGENRWTTYRPLQDVGLGTVEK